MRGIHTSHQSLWCGIGYRSTMSRVTGVEMRIMGGGGDRMIIVCPGNEVTVVNVSRHDNKER